ncbi:MAG: phenylalanine-4-hydroxylase [Chlamydiales bacterium]|jgi:phenylalanine-4-hydroxylase
MEMTGVGKTKKTLIGLTTTKAPFIEEAKGRDELYIQQPYELYSETNQETWRKLYKRIQPRWEKYANDKFLKGVETLSLNPNKIPKLEDINEYLSPISGFKAIAVTGYVPTFLFFDALRQREFPTTVTIRDIEMLDYLPEPDIFHDVAGHVPMHTDPEFADVLVRFGELAIVAAERVNGMKNKNQQLSILTAIIQALSRVFWYTVEFGLMKENGGFKAYGSGLLSSYAELEHCIESPDVQRFPFQLEWAINQTFFIDRMQPILFVIDSFDQLYTEIGRMRKWLLEGKLDFAAPGEPQVNQDDLDSFLKAVN